MFIENLTTEQIDRFVLENAGDFYLLDGDGYVTDSSSHYGFEPAIEVHCYKKLCNTQFIRARENLYG